MAEKTKVGKFVSIGLGISAVTFVITSTLFRNKFSSMILENHCTKEALERLNNHKGAKSFLGEPIEPTSATTLDSANTKVKVNVTGPKSTGILFFTVNVDKLHNVTLNSADLQIGKDDTRRLVIKPAEPNVAAE